MSTPHTSRIEFSAPDFSFAWQISQNFPRGTDPALIAQTQVDQLRQTEAFLAGIERQLLENAQARALSEGEQAGLQQARAWLEQARAEREEIEYREALIACDRPSQHIANAIRWNAICTDPDWCEVGGAPVAFDSVAVIENPVLASPDVKAQDVPVYRVNDMHYGVQATAGVSLGSGSAAGSGYVKVLSGSASVYVNNRPVARNASAALINCGPDGLGGVRGALLTEEKPPEPPSAPSASDSTIPPGQRTSPRLEELKRQEAALRERLVNVDNADEIVRFEDLKGMIDQLQGTRGSWTDYAAQLGRGVLKGAAGIGEGAYELGKLVVGAAQRQTVVGMQLTTVQAQIAAENLRLGNTTLGGVGSAAGDLALSIVVPPDAQTAWSQGNPLEAGANTAINLLTIGVGGSKAAGAIRGSAAADDAAAAARGARAADEAADGARGSGGQSQASGVHVSPVRTVNRNGYTYHLDEQGRVTKVEGDLVLDQSQGRSQSAQRNAGGPDRLPNDQGGHYVGRRFKGPTDDFNHFAQNGNFNNGAYKALENSWQRLIESGRSVRIEIIPQYIGNNLRPDSIIVRQWVDGVESASRSFLNRPGGI